MFVLRAMAQAQYRTENVGHFALASVAYVHFTSPIRRYPDLLLHRAIRHAIAKGKPGSYLYGDADMATRCGHCSQCERRADAAEHELPLNKLLCGLDLRQPVPAGIDITDQERQTIENMLRAIIAHWGALGSTSVAGLREAFLQRPGLLRQQGDAWQLKVEKKTLDILLEKLPWGFSVIRHPWMPQALMVDWC